MKAGPARHAVAGIALSLLIVGHAAGQSSPPPKEWTTAQAHQHMMAPQATMHPTVRGYQVWADALKPLLTDLLGPPAAVDHAPPPTGDPSARVRGASVRAMTTPERQRLVAHLEMTASWLVDEVSGLSPAQRDFRPSPDAWSIMQVLDHLVIVGQIYWQDLQTAVRAPATSRASGMTDADVLWYGIDRTRREKAIPSEVPGGQLRDVGAALDAYRAHRARLLQYVKTTTDDLRSHVVERQLCDAYQWALLISTHEQRHILQIREIKAHPKFPR